MRGTVTPHGGWVSLAIVALLLAPTAPGWAAPSSGSSPGEIPRLEASVKRSLDATIVDNYARVEVTVEIDNPGASRTFPLEVPLPDEAYVTNLTIHRNATTYVADIQPRQKAREDHEEAQREHRSSALVEAERGDSVYRYGVHVPANETVRAQLTYESYLTAEGGTYTLALRAPQGGQGARPDPVFDVQIRHGAGLGEVWSSPPARVERLPEGMGLTYPASERSPHTPNLTVHYHVDETEPGGRLVSTVENGTGSFVHRFRAGPGQADVPVDLSLVLDTSGSMSGNKIQQVQSAALQVVDALDPEDRLHVTLFDDQARSLWPGLRGVNETSTRSWTRTVANLSAKGSTNVGQALEQGFAPFPREANTSVGDQRLQVLAFLTDGRATTGLVDDERLRELAQEVNRANAHVFALAFGSEADWSLVHGLAEDGDGMAQRVEAGPDAEVELSQFLSALTSPVLRNVTVDYEGEDVRSWRMGSRILFAGDELVYVGTFDPNRTHALNATVQASTVDGPESWTLSHDTRRWGPSYVPALVAYQRVQALEARIDAHGEREAWVDNATRLALEHGFVTERTSLQVDVPRASLDETSTTPGLKEERNAPPTDDAPTDPTVASDNARDLNATTSDVDGDGVPSHADLCPHVANPRQVDHDGDGVGDACDDADDPGSPTSSEEDPTRRTVPSGWGDRTAGTDGSSSGNPGAKEPSPRHETPGTGWSVGGLLLITAATLLPRRFR